MSKWRYLIDKLVQICYNNSVYKHTGVNAVSTNYGFLFKKSSLPKADLNALLTVEDFVTKANEIVAKGSGIEDCDIYNITKSLYFPMLKDFETDGFKEKYKQQYGSEKYKEWSYRFKIVENATKRFSKILFGADKWKEDFNEYKNMR